MWLTLKRIFKTGFINFWRNGFVSLSAVLVMIVSLAVFQVIIFTGAVLTHTLEAVKERVDVTISFNLGVSEEEALNLKKNLEGLPEVKEVEYMTADEVLEQFTERYIDNQKMLDALQELDSNPFGAMLRVRANEPSQYAGVAEYINENYSVDGDDAIIDEVNYIRKQEMISKLTKIIDAGEQLGFILTIVFVVISIIITFNTIRLTMYISRDEIRVMKLVGASHSFVSGPFIVVGAMYGLVASLLTLLIFYPLTYWVGPTTAQIFEGLNLFKYYVASFADIFFMIVVAGILIGSISSYLAIKKYLRENR